MLYNFVPPMLTGRINKFVYQIKDLTKNLRYMIYQKHNPIGV